MTGKEKGLIDELKLKKAFTLSYGKILGKESIGKVYELARDNGEPFVRFLECAKYLNDYYLNDASKGSPDSLKNIRSFEDMTEANICHYVYWRTQLFNGNYQRTKKEYILVYINEIANLVGLSSKEGLGMLLYLWEKCKELTDLEFFDIIKDYCIIHSISPFSDVAQYFDNMFCGITSFEVKIYSGDFTNTLPYFDKLSAQHKIIGSTFYNSEHGKYVDCVFGYVMDGVREYFLQKGVSFNEMIFERKVDVYEPFKNNPFVPKEVDFTEYVVSETERYFVSGNVLYADKLYPVKKHGKLISFILKHTESRIRELLYEKPLRIHDGRLYQDDDIMSTFNTSELVKVIYNRVDSVLKDEVIVRKKQTSVFDKFDKMRNLSRTPNGMIFGSELFVKQVRFMEQFEYDESIEMVDFPNFYPAYSHMSNQQLESYFAWRTKIRKGIFENVDIGYVKLYLNETMLLANCQDEKDALTKLIDFWKGMREKADIDSLMEDTIVEFYVLKGLDMPFSEIAAIFPRGYFCDKCVIDEIAKNNYEHAYEYLSRRFKISGARDVISTLKGCIAKALKKASDLLVKECKFELSGLLVGKMRKKLVPLSNLGYFVDDMNLCVKEVTCLNDSVKYVYEDGSLYLHSYEYGKREKAFCEYVINVLLKAIKGYRKGDFSDIPFDIVFSGIESYSKHAEIIESMRFVDVLTSEVKEVYKEARKKEKEKLECFMFGDKKIWYDPEVTRGIEDVISSVDTRNIISLERMYEYLDEVGDHLPFHAFYNLHARYCAIFLVQALLIEDLEYHEEQIVKPKSMFLRYKQGYGFASCMAFLNYLNWRTNARRGIFKDMDFESVKTYLNELVNCIGVENEEDIIDKITDCWSHVKGMDGLFETAIRDAYIYYNYDKPFSHYAEKFPDGYSVHYLFRIYKGDYEAASTYMLEKSSYRAKESAFGKSDHGCLIDQCLPLVLERLDKLFTDYDLSLPTFILGRKKECEHTLFDGFNFTRLRKGKSTAAINDHCVFEWCDGNSYFVISNDVDEVSFEMYKITVKLTEIALRKLLDFKGKLSSPLVVSKARSMAIEHMIETIGAEKINECVLTAVADVLRNRGIFFEDHVAPATGMEMVDIDFTKLDDIREVSRKLTEKLVVDEEEEEVHVVEEDKRFCDIINVSGDDPYSLFANSLDENQRRVLLAIIKGEDVHSVARELGIMLEVTIEDINEVALETTGDTLVDVDCTIIEEYLDNIIRVLGG